MTDKAEAARRLILRGGASAAAGFLIRFGARLLFLFIAGRLFGAVLFGAYSIAIAVVEAAVGIGGLGTKRMLFQWLNDRDEASDGPAFHLVLDAALMVVAASLAVAGLIAGAVLLLPATLLSENTATALLLLAPMTAGQALLDLLLAATRWKHFIRYDVVGRSVVEPYVGVAAAVLAYLAGWQLHGLVIAYWAGTLAAIAYALRGLRRSFGSWQLRRYRPQPAAMAARLPGVAFNTGADFLTAVYQRMDLYLVGLLLGEGPAGVYGMARQVSTPIRQVRQSFDGQLIPIVANTVAVAGPGQAARALASAARLMLAIQLPLLIGLVVIGVPFLALFGPAFVGGYGALLLLAAAESVQGAFSVGDLIFAYRRPDLGLRIIAVSLAVGIGAGLLLIPPLGIAGAGLSVLVTYAARALHRRHVLKAAFGVAVPPSYNVPPAAAAVLGLAAALLAMGLMPVPHAAPAVATALAAGLGVYAAALVLWLRRDTAGLALNGFVAKLPDGSEPRA